MRLLVLALAVAAAFAAAVPAKAGVGCITTCTRNGDCLTHCN